MSDEHRLRRRSDAAEWITFAERDYRAARLLLSAVPPLLEAAAFHCQQAAEKLLKAFLVLEGKPTPKLHDLGQLSTRLDRYGPILADMEEALESLSPWAVTGRYPDLEEAQPTEAEIRNAFDLLDTLMDRVRQAATDLP
ncbi:HEPN domain-containing protein [Paracraurococcus lichenis]|uniref:HEPN domain-containing protein n=1 Tax=Paracraurococcus lichenis TaxID=3064888 RepID=A0ABT9E0F0_9PROT|nr:HEPN domain-containing protein [Paracraurococcus sp. LOR1-02]MDO9709630.1 HEPN domain-containing protein [Paracraurococcus sp. LOR1-02]